MTQTLLAPASRTTTVAAPWVLVLHGRDPETHHVSTWHGTPLMADDEPTDLCRVERVAGEINHPAVWMQATKEAFVVTREELFELVRRVSVA